jgi:hypothetical protein
MVLLLQTIALLVKELNWFIPRVVRHAKIADIQNAIRKINMETNISSKMLLLMSQNWIEKPMAAETTYSRTHIPRQFCADYRTLWLRAQIRFDIQDRLEKRRPWTAATQANGLQTEFESA